MYESIAASMQPFPIGLWVPPPADEVSIARYKEIRDAGFTFVIGFREIEHGEETVAKALDCAQANGLKYLVNDPRVKNLGVTELSAMEPLISRFSSHPAYLGHLFFDEPGADQFERLAALARSYESCAPDGLAYVNLLPDYASAQQLRTATYADHVEQFLLTFKPKALSYDYYPLRMNGSVKATYFSNLWTVREACHLHQVPFWVFIQALSYNGTHREPNEAEIRWQVNMSLAFGAKGIQYFTYWTPDAANGETFEKALIGKDGAKTSTYWNVQRVNDEVAIVGPILQSLQSEGLLVSGETPAGVERVMQSFGSVVSLEGDPAIAGCFSSDNHPHSIFVVNRDYSQPADSVIVFDDNRQLTIRLEPGEGKLIPLSQ
ncbi:beta-galactosidase [Cohnella soli]|uniref:Beta-galactosidase n=1 Tax=Cohnella soli TaxID=425005 RepID=A0ABW0HZ16_9BACL